MNASTVATYVRALQFAARAHGEQRTPTGLPYLVHLCSVAAEVLGALRAEPERDEALAVGCALLHDVLEDTATTPQALEQAFGAAIAQGVQALTKNATLPKPERMPDSLERITRQPPEIGLVKLADRITNLAPPPSNWSAEKVAAYRAEGQFILERLGTSSPYLAQRLTARLARYPAE